MKHNSSVQVSSISESFILRSDSFFFLKAATQLARQVQEERTQAVCSNKVARKRLTESNGTPVMDLGHMNVG